MPKLHKYIFTNSTQEMQTTATYHAVFYDVDKPKTFLYAMNKRIPESLFNNLCDGFPGKEVELRANDEFLAHYRILSHVTFQIFNSMENTYFIVCDCKRVKIGEITPITHQTRLPHANG